MFPRLRSLFFLIPLTLAFLAGCKSSDPEVPPKPGESSGAGTQEEEVLLQPFDAPPLEELEAKVTWEDQLVVDPMDLLREKQAQTEPLVTVEEALQLRNNSMDENAKTLNASRRVAGSDAEVEWDATIVRHLSADIKSSNPLMINSTAEFDVLGLIGFEIFGFDWNMTPLATSDTVKSWQTSKDRMYDKVVLRDDLTWSDGTPITAHDVVFSFQTIMNPKVPVPAVRQGADKLRWIEAYDDYTLVYFHSEPLATNMWNLNFPTIPKHIYEESIKEDVTLQDSDYHVKMEDHPVCGGPYKMVKREQGQEIVCVRRDEYFFKDGQPIRPLHHFKEVRFKIIKDPNTSLLALKAGEIEDLELTAEQWIKETDKNELYEKNTRVTATEWIEFHFIWNCKTPFFSDVRTRKAMSYAFDHDEMLTNIFYGLYEPASGPWHSEHWVAPKTPLPPYKQDFEKAEQLLDEAGWIDSDGDGIRDKEIGGKSVKFEFTINVAESSDNGKKACELLKSCLDRIGVVCHVRPLEFTVLQEKEFNHQFHAAMGGWGAGADPYTTKNIFGTDEDRNFGSYSNPEVDRLFEAGEKEFDRQKRAEIYSRIHTILYEDQPYTWLFYRNAFYGYNKAVRGYNFSPRGPYHYSPGFSSIWKAVSN